MKTKIKVMVDGKEQEIEIDLGTLAKQHGFLTKEEVTAGFKSNEGFEAELARRLKGKVSLEEIKDSAELRKKAFDVLGVQVGEDGKPKITVDQLAAAQEQWRKTELEPVALKLKNAEGEVSTLLDSMLESTILSTGATIGVKKPFLTPVATGHRAPIVAMMKDMFVYSPEHKQYFAKGDPSKPDEKFALSANPTEFKTPYKGVVEYMGEWGKTKDNAMIDAQKPGGAGLGSQTGTGDGRTVIIPKPTPGTHVTLQQIQEAEQQAGAGGRVVVAPT